jgi:threonine dehydrogenase-like Zn-dependent dehydrogenase
METAINGVWDAGVQPGDRITVIGGGTIGCLVAWLAGRMPGCDVELVDVIPTRAEVARALGVRYASPDTASNNADVIVHASGTVAGLEAALRIAAFEATIVELSWYGNQQVPLELGGSFHSQRLTLKSSQVGRVASSQRARWTTRRRMQLAIAMLGDPVLDRLITGESAFKDLPAVMEHLANAPGASLCHRIRY